MNRITKSAVSKAFGLFDGRFIYWSVAIDSSSVNNAIIALDTYTTGKKDGHTIYSWITMIGKNAAQLFVSTLPGFPTVMFTDSGTKGKVFSLIHLLRQMITL